MGLHLLPNVVTEDDKIWMLVPTLSILCVMDKKTKNLKYVTDFCKEKDRSGFEHSYYGIVKVNDCIYAYPNRADNIVIYDITLDAVRYMSLEWEREEWREFDDKLSAAYYIAGQLYLIGQFLPVVIKIDVNTLEQKTFHLETQNAMWKKSKQIGNKIYIPSLDSAALVIFDTSTDTYEIKDVPICAKGIACVEHQGDQLLVVPTDSADIYELDIEKWTVNKRYDLNGIAGLQYDKGETPFMHLFIEHNSYWLFPWNANMIVKIDTAAGTAESVYTYTDQKRNRYINASWWDDNHIFGYYAYGEHLDLCNTQTGEIDVYPNLPPCNMDSYWKNKLKDGCNETIYESEIGLSCFLKLI